MSVLNIDIKIHSISIRKFHPCCNINLNKININLIQMLCESMVLEYGKYTKAQAQPHT